MVFEVPYLNRSLTDVDAAVFAFVAEAIDSRSQVCCNPSQCSNRCVLIGAFVGCWAVCSSVVVKLMELDAHLMPKCYVAMDVD